MKLLHIAASPKVDEQSVGKRVANAFVDAYFNKHEQVQYRYIDLHTLEIPAMTKNCSKPLKAVRHSVKRRASIKIYDSLCNEFITADRYVISFPNWNLTAYPVLVSYMLAVIRAGKAFRYTEQGSEGLLHNKRLCYVVSSGGDYLGNSTKRNLYGHYMVKKSVFGLRSLRCTSTVL